MNFNEKNIEDWFCSLHNDPRYSSHITNYNSIKAFLAPIHEEVKAVVTRIDPSIYLNAHGLSHIKMVINKVSLLLSNENIQLTPTEVYFLLLAIQFHDIGHIINGRDNHAQDAGQIISKIATSNLNAIEKKAVFKIAAAHSGKKNDPIGQLPIEDTISNERIRYRLLAALVRLADELSDGRDRASNFLLSIGAIPEKSVLFHTFSACLDTFYPELETHSIRMKFYLDHKTASTLYKKGDSDFYVVDEIFARSLTTYTECLYYNRFVPEYLRVNSINVEICFIADVPCEPDYYNSLKYSIKETGYPSLSSNDIYKICENELTVDGVRIDGQYISNQIKR